MAFELLLHSPAPPDRVLSAIKDDTREWRESKIPRALWKRGVLQVIGDIDPPRFRLRLDRRWHHGEGGDPLVMTGQVLPNDDGGSKVIARCGTQGAVRWVVILFVIVLVSGLILDGEISWSLLTVGLVFVAIAAASDHGVSRESDVEAAYLAERLEQAVMAAAQPARPVPPA